MQQIKQEQLGEIIKDKLVVVVFEGGDWCAFCKAQKPVLEEIIKEYPDVKFYSLNFSSLAELQGSTIAKTYNISAVPEIVFFSEGNLIGRRKGYFIKKSKDNNAKRITDALNDFKGGTLKDEVNHDMKKISLEQLKGIADYLLNSVLPSSDVQKIISIFNSLPPVE